MSKITGNKTLHGTHGAVWEDGDKIWEFTKIEIKDTANREDVQLDMGVDSKITGLKGEFTLTLRKVYSRFDKVLADWQKGIDTRCQIITSLGDPDAMGGQEERYSIDNCWFNDLPLVKLEKGAVIEEEVSGGFTPTDMINLDRIS